MSEFYGVLNLPTLQEVAEIVSRFSEPGDEYMTKYIAEAKFTYAPVENEKSYHKYDELRGWRPEYKLCHFIKDGKPVNDKMYVQKKDTPVYKLPYAKSGAVSHLDPSQGGENITAAIVNGDNELWYKTDNGWVNEKYLSLTMAVSITQPKTEVVKGVVYGIEKLPVRVSNNSSYTITDYIPEGTVINITKKLNSWYQVEFDSKTGYVESRFVELLENNPITENTTENK